MLVAWDTTSLIPVTETRISSCKCFPTYFYLLRNSVVFLSTVLRTHSNIAPLYTSILLSCLIKGLIVPIVPVVPVIPVVVPLKVTMVSRVARTIRHFTDFKHQPHKNSHENGSTIFLHPDTHLDTHPDTHPDGRSVLH